MSASLEVNITSDPAMLQDIRLKTEAIATSAGFDEGSVCELGLVVNEALANVIRHAYGNAHDKPILYTITTDEKGMSVHIRDWGNGVNPSRLPLKPKDPLVPGGLGLICLRNMMDHVEFVPQPDGMLLKMSRTKDHKPMGAN